jgi:hypothetical protein
MRAKATAGMISQNAAAKILGYGLASLKKWRSTGKGPVYYKVRNRVFYKREDLDRFLATQTVVRVEPAAKLARRSA